MKHALDTFDDFLATIWMDNSPEEAYALWQYITANSPPYASEVFAALDYVLSNPPSDLIERMQQKGWIFLSRDDPDETLFSFEEHLHWLREMMADLRRIPTSDK